MQSNMETEYVEVLWQLEDRTNQTWYGKRQRWAARREIGKWLNEQPNREVDKQALAELCVEFDRLRLALEVILDAPGGGPARRIAAQALGGLTNKNNRREASGLIAVLGTAMNRRMKC